MERVNAIVHLPGRPASRDRGRQDDRREIERDVRREAVRFQSSVREHGGTAKEAAAELHLKARTLRAWARQWASDGLTAKNRGRPLVHASPRDLAEVIEDLDLRGPLTGVATLKRLHTSVTRRELSHLVVAYRRLFIAEHDLTAQDLCWLMPGAVWGIDHTQLAAPLDDGRRFALSVRDLATGYELEWCPVERQDAESTVAILEPLFVAHGAPLVVKSDQGGAFRARVTQALFRRWSVEHLLSPACTPRYNGALETSMRWLKALTDHSARQAGHGESLRPEDLARARWIANETPRPSLGASHADCWKRRVTIPPGARALFRATVANARSALYQQAQAVYRGTAAARLLLNARARQTIQREAIVRALVAHGILLARRRPITLHELSARAAEIA